MNVFTYLFLGFVGVIVLIALVIVVITKWDDYICKRTAAKLQASLDLYMNSENKNHRTFILCMRVQKVLGYLNIRKKNNTATLAYMKKALRLITKMAEEIEAQVKEVNPAVSA